MLGFANQREKKKKKKKKKEKEKEKKKKKKKKNEVGTLLTQKKEQPTCIRYFHPSSLLPPLPSLPLPPPPSPLFSRLFLPLKRGKGNKYPPLSPLSSLLSLLSPLPSLPSLPFPPFSPFSPLSPLLLSPSPLLSPPSERHRFICFRGEMEGVTEEGGTTFVFGSNGVEFFGELGCYVVLWFL